MDRSFVHIPGNFTIITTDRATMDVTNNADLTLEKRTVTGSDSVT